jgi:hypothetical protein
MEIVFIGWEASVTLSAQNIIPTPLLRINDNGRFLFNSETKLYTNLHGKEKKLLKTLKNIDGK